jgi:methionyl-tRNA formyltransferase
MESVNVVGVLREKKVEPLNDSKIQTEGIKRHLKNLACYESELMPSAGFVIPNLLELNINKINEEEVLEWSRERQPDAIALFGTSILGSNWTNSFSQRIVNLHLGSSPRYRGSATLFWPFYNDEIEHVAATIHLATDKVDAGGILEKVSINPNQVQNYYQFTTETIKLAIDKFPLVLTNYLRGFITPYEQDVNLQKYLYRRADFSEMSLNKVLEIYGI